MEHVLLIFKGGCQSKWSKRSIFVLFFNGLPIIKLSAWMINLRIKEVIQPRSNFHLLSRDWLGLNGEFITGLKEADKLYWQPGRLYCFSHITAQISRSVRYTFKLSWYSDRIRRLFVDFRAHRKEIVGVCHLRIEY